MKVPVVNQFCCGFSLKTGTLFIGVFWAFASLVVLISYSVFADNLASSVVPNLPGLRGVAIVTAIMSGLQLVVSCMLVLGTLQTKPSLMLPWILVCGLLALVNVICYLVAAIMYFVALWIASGIAVLITGFFTLIIMVYFLIVVHSYYASIHGGPAPGIQQYP